jgi:hypothetical protein
MESIIEYAVKNKLTNGNNRILNRSLATFAKEDRMIKILSKEITEFAIDLIIYKDKNFCERTELKG